MPVCSFMEVKPNATAVRWVYEYLEATNDVDMQKKLRALLDRHDWNVTLAAGELSINRVTLNRIIGARPALVKARTKARIEQLKRSA
jgi:hypothetical protein